MVARWDMAAWKKYKIMEIKITPLKPVIGLVRNCLEPLQFTLISRNCFEPLQFTLISMRLIRYLCGHISGPHEASDPNHLGCGCFSSSSYSTDTWFTICLLIIWKCILQAFHLFIDLYSKRGSPFNLLVPCSKGQARFTFYNTAIHRWNSLLNEIKDIHVFKLFRKLIKKHLANHKCIDFWAGLPSCTLFWAGLPSFLFVCLFVCLELSFRFSKLWGYPWYSCYIQGLRASSLQFTSPLEFNAIFRDGFPLRHELTAGSKIRDPVPAKFKHVTNIVTCMLLCCDYVTYVPALKFPQSWLRTLGYRQKIHHFFFSHKWGTRFKYLSKLCPYILMYSALHILNAVVLSAFRCDHPENQTKIFRFLHFMNRNKCRLHKTWGDR